MQHQLIATSPIHFLTQVVSSLVSLIVRQDRDGHENMHFYLLFSETHKFMTVPHFI